METLETKNKDKDQNKTRDESHETEAGNKNSGDSIAKVTISKKAETVISELMARINEGFEFGRVNRHQLLSWILTKFSEDCSDTEIRAIRGDHFDEMTLLELSLKRFKQSGGLPPELKKMLLAQAGWEDSGKRSQKKSIDAKAA